MGMKELADGLRECVALSHLDLGSNGLGLHGAASLAEVLKSCTRLRHLDVGGNGIRNAAVRALLQHSMSLTWLNLSWNALSADGLDALADVLWRSPALAHLDLSDNRFGVRGLHSLCKVLRSCSSLVSLRLKNTVIPEHGGVAALATALRERDTLTALDLREHWESGESGSGLVAAVAVCSQLASLSLSCVDPSPFQGTQLSEALRGSGMAGRMVSLGLSCESLMSERLGQGSLAALAALLGACTRLTQLNLARQIIGSEGAQCIGHSLGECVRLTQVDLSWNLLGDSGTSTLASALERCTALEQLELSYNEIGAGGTERVAQLLSQCRALSRLVMTTTASSRRAQSAWQRLSGPGGAVLCGTWSSGAQTWARTGRRRWRRRSEGARR